MKVYFVLLAYNRVIGKNEILGYFENFKIAEEEYDKKNINDINSIYTTLKLELVIDEDCLGDDIEDLKTQTLKQKWNDDWLNADVYYNIEELDKDKLVIMKPKIYFMKSEDFNRIYPEWHIPINGKYTSFPSDKYVLIDGEKFVGIDNSTNDAWTEEFNTLQDAMRWIDEFLGKVYVWR